MAKTLDFFSPEAQAALDLAKRVVPQGGELTPELLMAAAYKSGHLDEEVPQLGAFLPELPRGHRKVPEEVTVAEPLGPVLHELSHDDMVTLDQLMAGLITSDAGHRFLAARGMSDQDLTTVEDTLAGRVSTQRLEEHEEEKKEGKEPAWRASEERDQVLQALGAYGRLLTGPEPLRKTPLQMDRYLHQLQKSLVKMRRPSVIVIGQPGTGKTALVYEFARRITTGDPSIAPALRDRDVFELSPSFLRAGASMVGEYDERISAVIKVLEANPQVILFVDEVHSMLQSGMHERGPFSDANEALKQALGHGAFSMIGATTISEYRHYIAPDGALARRFGLVKVDPPTPDETGTILEQRLPEYLEHYAPLRIPEPLLRRTVEITEDLLPSRFQPVKSLDLLDEACALCTMEDPAPEELTEDKLLEALEAELGHGVIQPGMLTVDSVLERLKVKIVGQDDTLGQVATSFVAGISEDWTEHDGPRGIFLFCGPTGVGKTETALTLATILGGGREALVRVDCNTISGTEASDEGPVINRLLGVPPGYIGYARGEGGVLSKVRDFPECIVLFDEIEKAHPAVGKLLLQILDEGRVYDTDSNLLDFRRSFIIFTTNAGCTYETERMPVGFAPPGEYAVNAAGAASPKVSVQAVQDELRSIGYGEEFLGRNIDYIVFEAMERDDVRVVLQRQLESLDRTAELRGYDLEWDDEVFEHLLSEWRPHFGARHLFTILRNRIVEQLAIAEVQGELRDIKRIRLTKRPPGEGRVGDLGTRVTEGDTMTIYVT